MFARMTTLKLIVVVMIMASVSAAAAPNKLDVSMGYPFEAVASNAPNKVEMTAFANEDVVFTLDVKYNKPLAEMKIAAQGDFNGPSKYSIPRENVSVRLVQGTELVGIKKPDGVVYSQTTVSQTPAKFWVVVDMPKKAWPGAYKGNIAFYYDNKFFDSVPVKINVKRLPMPMPTSSKQYAFYTDYVPPAGGCGGDETKADFATVVDTVNDMGINVMSLNVTTDNAEEAMNAYKEENMLGPVPVSSYAHMENLPTEEMVDRIDDLRKQKGLPSFVYFIADNPVAADEIAAALDRAENLWYLRASKAARVSTETAAVALEPEVGGMCYHVDMQFVKDRMDGKTERTSSKWEWFWWDARKSVESNRLYAGVGLWKSGFDGAMPYWPTSEGFKVTDGVWSLHAEAIRAGIEDTRHITLFMRLLRELKDKKRGSDKAYIANAENYLSGYLSLDGTKYTPASLRQFREKLRSYSLEMQNRLK